MLVLAQLLSLSIAIGIGIGTTSSMSIAIDIAIVSVIVTVGSVVAAVVVAAAPAGINAAQLLRKSAIPILMTSWFLCYARVRVRAAMCLKRTGAYYRKRLKTQLVTTPNSESKHEQDWCPSFGVRGIGSIGSML